MNVKKLKELLNDVPDDYIIRSRAENSNLQQDEIPWQFGFSGYILQVKVIEKQNAIMLIRGHE